MAFFRWRTWQLGVKALLLHPLRSLLTVLGIFIGVASVIWLLAIGEGISLKAQEQIAGLGADNIIVRSVQPPSENTDGFRGPVQYGITRQDFNRLSELIPTIDRAVPLRELRRQFRYTDRMVDGRLVGCTPEYQALNRMDIERGHFITAAEVDGKKNVCVLGSGTAERLFPFEDPIGRAIHVEQDYYVVVGVMRPRDPTAGVGGSLSAQDFANDVYIPISTLWQRIGDLVITRRSGSFTGERIELSQVTLRVKDTDSVPQTADVVRSLLAKFHRDEDYGVTVPLELLEQARSTRLMFIAMMGMIAAISLVVGGIGIMNIMLATVTERTREIGIRRALGAKRRDIIRQFLIETTVLSVMGGVTGILGGIVCGPAFRGVRSALEAFFPDLLMTLPDVVRTVTPVVVPWSIPLAFGIAVGVGILFGLYPARRASMMNPIEALRHVA